MSSYFLLSRLSLFDLIIINFSVRQRSHRLELLLEGLALVIAVHLML